MALGKVGSDSDGGDGIFAEINITPLTDVFLVLLIIFMVTSSVMSQSGVDVNLPQAAEASSTTEPGGVIITLLPDSAIQVNQQPIAKGDWPALEGAITAAFKKTSSRLVILEGDRQAFLGNAIEIMNQARRAGADRFAIATTPEGASAGGDRK